MCVQLSFLLLPHIGGIDLMICAGQKHLTLLSFHYWRLGNLCCLFDVQRRLYTIWHRMRTMIRKWTFHIVDSCRIETLSKHGLRGCSQRCLWAPVVWQCEYVLWRQEEGYSLMFPGYFGQAFIMWPHLQFSLLTIKLAWTSISKWINIINMISLMPPKCYPVRKLDRPNAQQHMATGKMELSPSSTHGILLA